MANIVHIQSNFTAGEISPRLFGRVDLSKYNNGAKTLQNAVVQTHGGVSRRPGTKFVSQIKDETTSDILVPILVEFHYNATDSYVLELGATHATNDNVGYMRPYRTNATTGLPYRIKTTGGADVEISTLKWKYTDLENLRFCQSADTMFIFYPRKGILKLQRVGAEDEVAGWACVALQDSASGTNTFTDGPYLPMNGTDISLSCGEIQDVGSTAQTITAYANDTSDTAAYPFLATDVGRLIRLEDPVKGHKILEFTNYGGTAAHGTSTIKVEGNAMYDALIAGGYSGDTSVEVEFYNVTRGPTMLDGTLHLARGFSETGTDTLFNIYHADTGEKEPYTDNDDYSSNETDGFVRITPANNVGWGIITAVSDEGSGDDEDTYQTVTVTVKSKFISGEKTKNWRLGAWSDTTGYPSTGTFHQNRLWTANTTNNPDTIWASETNVYDSFSPTDVVTSQVVDSQALNITLSSRQVNAVNHMKSDSQGLMVFTEGGEWLGRATNPNAPITPTDVSFTKQSTYGSQKKLEPLRLGVAYLVFQRDATTLREFTYEFSQDRFNAPNQTLLAEHITRNKVTDAAFQLGTTQRVWCCTATGELLSLTYDKEQEVVAWSKHVMAVSGTGGSANTVATVHGVARTPDANDDNIWLLVKRKIGTVDKYFVEMMVNDFEVTDAHATAFFVECGLSGYSSGGATAWSGLTHLNGESVYALVDGVQYGPFTVSGGAITTVSANYVQVGLRYKTLVETVPLNVQQSLESKSKRKRIFKAFANMYRSLSGKLGTQDKTYDMIYSAATSSPPELRTEMTEVSFPDNSDREMIVVYEQEDVHPSNLLSITSEVHLGI